MKQQPMQLGRDWDKYECNICKDKEILLVDDKVVYCECALRKKAQKIMKSCNITEEIKVKTFENYKEDVDSKLIDIKKMCEEYTDGIVKYVNKTGSISGAPSLGLCGTSGCGKTHLITAISSKLVKHGIYPTFFNWVQGFKEWMSFYNYDEEKYKVDEIRGKLYNCQLLVIDDLCKDMVNKSWVAEMYGIIDYRYRKQLPIVFSSEYYAELASMLSEAHFGRLVEMTWNEKKKKHYIGTCFVKSKEENPLKYNYRLRNL